MTAWATNTAAPRSNLRDGGVIFVVGTVGIFRIFILEVIVFLAFQSINTSRVRTSPFSVTLFIINSLFSRQ